MNTTEPDEFQLTMGLDRDEVFPQAAHPLERFIVRCVSSELCEGSKEIRDADGVAIVRAYLQPGDRVRDAVAMDQRAGEIAVGEITRAAGELNQTELDAGMIGCPLGRSGCDPFVFIEVFEGVGPVTGFVEQIRMARGSLVGDRGLEKVTCHVEVLPHCGVSSNRGVGLGNQVGDERQMSADPGRRVILDGIGCSLCPFKQVGKTGPAALGWSFAPGVSVESVGYGRLQPGDQTRDVPVDASTEKTFEAYVRERDGG